MNNADMNKIVTTVVNYETQIIKLKEEKQELIAKIQELIKEYDKEMEIADKGE